MPILANKQNILYNQNSGVDGWRRPEDWLAMPTGITSANQTFVGLHAVIEDGDNYVAFRFTTSAGQYQVDWGDGTIDLVNSNVNAEHQYNFATVSNSTLTSRGYKQCMITVTPVSGNLLTCDFQQKYLTSPVQNQGYSSGFLDCILSMPNASGGGSINFGGNVFSGIGVRHSYVERFDIKTIGGCTNLQRLFQTCSSLQSIPLFNTQNVTSMTIMFFDCTMLQYIPLFNTSNVTNMSIMFQNCRSLQTVPLFNTQNVTNMSGIFNSCLSLQSVPLFDTTSVTNMSQMFIFCNSLKTVPLFNTQNVTNMSNMFNGCTSLQSIPLFNTQNVTDISTFVQNCQNLQSFPTLNTSVANNMQFMFVGCSSLNSIPALPVNSINLATGVGFGTQFANNASSLNRCQMVFARTVSFLNGQLSRDAIVEIFNNLVDRTLTTSATITITGNWGVTALSASDLLIATNKNWTITG
jgi:surface protein